ncbi:MAG TPA: response regulator [Gemmatimonadales bacterium]|nr:response regulator [Gemmatimonadales bacterium]
MADTILLIHGDAGVLGAVGDHFDRLGYGVGRAATGEAGLEVFERTHPDVVILDLHLPDQSGLEALERLRAQGGAGGAEGAAVILLTRQGDTEMALRAMQMGAEHFFTQPLDLNHLAATTARVVEKVRLARQNALLRERAEALDRLLAAPWAGGVRQMRNVLERAMILARGAAQIGVERPPIPADPRREDGGQRHQPVALAEVERVHIERTLRFHGGNRTRSAQELGISRATLINKIKSYGLDV